MTHAEYMAAKFRYIEQVKAWNAANPEQARENARKRKAAWKARDPEGYREANRIYAAAWRARNPEKARAAWQRSNANRKGSRTAPEQEEGRKPDCAYSRTGTTVLTVEQSFNITEEKQNGR